MNYAELAMHEHLVPASGFRLLHTIDMRSREKNTREMHSLQPRKTAPQIQRAVRQKPQNTGIGAEERRSLGGITQLVFDIVGGRRRIDGLRKISVDPKTHAALLTLSKNTHLKGVALQSFHPSLSVSGAKIEFIGSCSIGPRVRAFTGTFSRRKEKGSRTWMLTAFRVI
ncbi:hypothetical protein [Corynebacterium lactis]|uniref:Uncharacterized protein n=1 Tax=Corynebacterium lactis RW2-5 TaxID=1408189 RepID=A0A0K2H311_9CORY|nr:hypothetical protein [Corynebacterium lactis]ALA68417.1 hypothetical protein CLAC_02845 [Corynebacterium lactis RW2-5]